MHWAALLLLLVFGLLATPTAASAHGPIDPPASKYLARIRQLPAGLKAKVVDGDQRLWLQVAPGQTVLVLDYRGAPYLRFSARGVQVNESSSMYYLNQVPPQIPPTTLGPVTAPQWHQVSGGNSYSWHDGRLHALALTVLAPGATYAGTWRIPLRVDGAATAISGGLFHAPDPPIVWFWPIVVVLACVPAAMRLRRSELDERIARALAVVALVAFAVVGAGQQLHGRPNVSVGQLLLLALVVVFTGWGLQRIVRRQHGWFTFFVIAAATLWEGASTIAVLLDGFVLIALPAFVARLAVVACLAAGIGLLPLIFAMAERPERRRSSARSGTLAPGDSGDGLTTETEEAKEAWEPSA
ncbi:MAG: hypothetical protein WAK93_10780 [Solirubrobacteraceae bacterium]